MYWYDLTLLTATCVAELGMLCVCLARRVRVIWILGLYSFVATLGMMLVAQYAPLSYIWLAGKIDALGNIVMAAVFVGLLSQIWNRRWLYVPISVAYLGLAISQLICTVMRWHHGTTPFVARTEMISWMVAMVMMAMTARLVPRLPRTPMLRHVWRDLTLGD